MQPHKTIRSNRKTIALQINENAELVVRAPYHVSQKRIDKFIEEKQEWLTKTQQKIIQRNELIQENSEFKDGKTILFLGKEYPIRIDSKGRAVKIEGNCLSFPASHVNYGEELLSYWYKKQAYHIIVPRVEQYLKALQLGCSKIGITSAKKRWGSCNSKGNINFSYRLVMVSPEIIDYVIVHELMHLKEMNHSAQFWAHVASVIPDYKKYRKWLRDNQHRFLV